MDQFQDAQIAAVNRIKRWWVHNLGRHTEFIKHNVLRLINGRKHGKIVEEINSEIDARCLTYKKTSSYLFGVLHGYQTKEYSWYSKNTTPYVFGVKHGREYDNDIEYDPPTFRDWFHGVRHGLTHYQRYCEASMLEIYNDDVIIDNKLYKYDTCFYKVINWAYDTECMGYGEWKTTRLPF
jgi:hypothetical protein